MWAAETCDCIGLFCDPFLDRSTGQSTIRCRLDDGRHARDNLLLQGILHALRHLLKSVQATDGQPPAISCLITATSATMQQQYQMQASQTQLEVM